MHQQYRTADISIQSLAEKLSASSIVVVNLRDAWHKKGKAYYQQTQICCRKSLTFVLFPVVPDVCNVWTFQGSFIQLMPDCASAASVHVIAT